MTNWRNPVTYLMGLTLGAVALQTLAYRRSRR